MRLPASSARLGEGGALQRLGLAGLVIIAHAAGLVLLTQFAFVFGGLYVLNSQVRSPPRKTDCSMLRIASGPWNWSSSSNHNSPM